MGVGVTIGQQLGRPVFRLEGVLDHAVSSVLANTILMAAGNGGLVVDLDDATLTSRDGVAQLVAAFEQRAAGRVALSCGRLDARRLLRNGSGHRVAVTATVEDGARAVPPGDAAAVR